MFLWADRDITGQKNDRDRRHCHPCLGKSHVIQNAAFAMSTHGQLPGLRAKRAMRNFQGGTEPTEPGLSGIESGCHITAGDSARRPQPCKWRLTRKHGSLHPGLPARSPSFSSRQNVLAGSSAASTTRSKKDKSRMLTLLLFIYKKIVNFLSVPTMEVQGANPKYFL